jgi:uncharacterized protein
MGVSDIKKRVIKAAPNLPHVDQIKKISLFGSRLHGDSEGDSDIDLLLEVDRPFTFFMLAHVQNALENELGNDVDLVTPDFLSKYFKDDVLNEAELLYEKG